MVFRDRMWSSLPTTITSERPWVLRCVGCYLVALRRRHWKAIIIFFGDIFGKAEIERSTAP